MTTLADVDPTHRTWLLAVLARALSASRAFRGWRTWPSAVVVVAEGGAVRVTSRADFAAYLAANALDAQARECRGRRVGLGQVLVWLEADNAIGAGAGFVVVDLRRELAAVGGSR